MTRPLAVSRRGGVGPWGRDLGRMLAWRRQPVSGDGDRNPVPRLPGFVESLFSPMVYEAVRQCFPGGDPLANGARCAMVLGSIQGDTTTADVASRRLAEGSRDNPLLFFQSVPTSILGHVSRTLGIRGPICTVAPHACPCASLLEMANLLLEDADLEQVIAIGVELAPNPRTAHVWQALAGPAGTEAPEGDVAIAMVIERESLAAGPGIVIEQIHPLASEELTRGLQELWGPDVRLLIGDRQVIDVARLAGLTSSVSILPGSDIGAWGAATTLVRVAVALSHLEARDAPWEAIVHESSTPTEHALIRIRGRGDGGPLAPTVHQHA